MACGIVFRGVYIGLASRQKDAITALDQSLSLGLCLVERDAHRITARLAHRLLVLRQGPPRVLGIARMRNGNCDAWTHAFIVRRSDEAPEP